MANRIPPNEFGPNDFGCRTSSVQTNDVATQAAPPQKPVQNAFLKHFLFDKQNETFNPKAKSGLNIP
jgi:hypothetical protein